MYPWSHFFPYPICFEWCEWLGIGRSLSVNLHPLKDAISVDFGHSASTHGQSECAMGIVCLIHHPLDFQRRAMSGRRRGMSISMLKWKRHLFPINVGEKRLCLGFDGFLIRSGWQTGRFIWRRKCLFGRGQFYPMIDGYVACVEKTPIQRADDKQCPTVCPSSYP